MKLHFWRSAHGNFGDDLNGWLWQELAPGLWREDDGIIFIGVGTILDRNIPQARLRVVMGSGTGYALIPSGIKADSNGWKVYGVRGPLSTRLLNLPPSLALTDPAILVANLQRFKANKRKGVAFVPHWKSLGYGSWEVICEELGIEYINPCDEAERVISRIGTAKLILAESMHGAIIADALRVQWTPIATSPEISPFKWSDWTLSLGMHYRPVCLAPSSWRELMRNMISKLSTHRAIFAPSTLFRHGTALTQLAFTSDDQLIENYTAIMRRNSQGWRKSFSLIAEALAKRLLRGNGRERNGKLYDSALQQMRQVAAMPGMLSSDEQHERQLERMFGALSKLQSDFSKGRLKVA
jgi:succinoglycan biosynthesis protein ExoV